MSRSAMFAAVDFSTGPYARRSGIAATLQAPWRATKRQTSWLSLAVFVVCSVVALAFGIAMPNARGQLVAMAWYMVGVGFVWAFGLSNLVLLARDARLMAIPGVLRNTTVSALAYGVLTVALPALIEGTFGWNAPLAALLAALAATAGLCFVLSPRWISTWMGFLPAILVMAHQTFHLTFRFDAGSLRWGALVLVVLSTGAALRWRRVLRDDRQDATGWNVPMILQLRQQAVCTGFSFDKQMFWRRNDRQHRYMDLRGVGARAPATTIEVALGALFVPQTLAGNLRRLAAVGWPVAMFAVAMLLVNLGHVHEFRKLLAITAISGAMWSGMFGMTMTLFAIYAMLKRRWTQGAEPALLALLPGLGEGVALHRSVLRAMFVKPFAVCAALWALMVGCEVALHLGFAALALTTLVVIGMCAATALVLLRAFIGRPFRPFVQMLLSGSALVLMCVTLPLAFVTPLAKLGSMAMRVEWLLLAAWLVFGACMVVLALRARNCFAHRAHPFLANAP